MSSIFSGITGLRTRQKELTYSDLSGANSKANSILVYELDVAGRYMFIDNDTDAKIQFWLVHPDAPDKTATQYRLYWFALNANRVINQDQIPALGMEIDAGARIYVSYAGSAPSSGSLQILAWG